MVGSVHEIGGVEVYDDTPFYEQKDKVTAQRDYLTAVLDAVRKFSCFDSLGHIDYVARYGGYVDKSIDFQAFDELINAILTEVIAKDKAIEVNTRLLTEPKMVVFYRQLLERYRTLGGVKVTLGSDSHSAERDWQAFANGQAIIQQTGFIDVTTY